MPLKFIMLPRSLQKNWKEVSAVSKKLGFPLVLKIVSPEIIHKSDIGGVIIGIFAPKDLKIASPYANLK
jgi:acyl-CoA synthetase (NDP forming)